MKIEVINQNIKSLKNKSSSLVGFSDEKNEILKNDEDRISEMINISDKNEQREVINYFISEILNNFKNGKKSKEEFNLMMERFVKMKYNEIIFPKNNDTKSLMNVADNKKIFNFIYNKDRAWSQEQVNEIVHFFEENIDDEDINKNDYFTKIFSAFNNEENSVVVNDLLAKSLISRIEEGSSLPESIQKEIISWSEKFSVLNKDIRFEFLATLLDNQVKIGQDVIDIVVKNIGLLGGNGIEELNDSLKKNSNNMAKALRVISILNHQNKKKHIPRFTDSGEKAYEMLKTIENETENYFLKIRAKQVLKKPLEDYTMEEKRQYLNKNWEILCDEAYLKNIIKPILNNYSSEEISKINVLND